MQKDMMRMILCILIGYMCGCFLTAAVVVKIRTGKSVFTIGSGNPGMANVMANVSKKAGALVLLGDILKTVLAIGTGAFLCSGSLCSGSLCRESMLLAGLGAVIGHNYPFWNGFHGGKGVTATITTLILLFPLVGTVCSLAGGLITLLTGDLWLGAILIPLFALPAVFFLYGIKSGMVLLVLLILMIQKNYKGVIKVLKGQEYRRFRKTGSKTDS